MCVSHLFLYCCYIIHPNFTFRHILVDDSSHGCGTCLWLRKCIKSRLASTTTEIGAVPLYTHSRTSALIFFKKSLSRYQPFICQRLNISSVNFFTQSSMDSFLASFRLKFSFVPWNHHVVEYQQRRRKSRKESKRRKGKSSKAGTKHYVSAPQKRGPG